MQRKIKKKIKKKKILCNENEKTFQAPMILLPFQCKNCKMLNYPKSLSGKQNLNFIKDQRNLRIK